MNELTERQVQILKSLIEEYIETAEPVGSETLEKKHNLSASPATIRNEMVRLTELGYFKKPHASAGRMPTPKGMKFYVNTLMKTKDLSVTEEVAVKELLWDHREQRQRFLKELTKQLAEKTKALAVTTTDQGDFYAAGYAHILDMPEFFDIDVTKSLLAALDEFETLHSLFVVEDPQEEVRVLLGEELGPKLQGPYGLVFTNFHTQNNEIGQVCVLGPTRLNYTQVVPTVRYFGGLVEEISKGW